MCISFLHKNGGLTLSWWNYKYTEKYSLKNDSDILFLCMTSPRKMFTMSNNVPIPISLSSILDDEFWHVTCVTVNTRETQNTRKHVVLKLYILPRLVMDSKWSQSSFSFLMLSRLVARTSFFVTCLTGGDNR